MSVGDEDLGVKLFDTAALNDTSNKAVWGCLTDPPMNAYMVDMPHTWHYSEKDLPSDEPRAGRCWYCKSTCVLPAKYNANRDMPTDFKPSELLELKRFQKELEEP